MFCDNGCLALFNDKKVYIIDKGTNKNIMHGTRDNISSLYMVPLTPEQNENMTECKIPERRFAGSLYKAKSKADLCTFLHLALWSPCTYTLINEIRNNFLSTFPGLTEQLVLKFLPKSEATAKRHIQQSFKGKNQHIPRNLMKRQVKNQLACTVFFSMRLIYPEKFTRIKPADSL